MGQARALYPALKLEISRSLKALSRTRNTNLPSPARLRGVCLSYIGCTTINVVRDGQHTNVFDLLQLERRGVVFYGLFVLLKRECATSVFERCLNGRCGGRVGAKLNVRG